MSQSSKALNKDTTVTKFPFVAKVQVYATVTASSVCGTVSAKDERMTIAFQFTKGLRMVKIAIAHCSPEDKFKRATGRELAIEKLDMGEFLQLPVQSFVDVDTYSMSEQAEQVADELYALFQYCNFSNTDNI